MRFHTGFAALFASSVLFSAGSAGAVDLEVTHWWTSGGEAAAAKVLAESYDKLGGDKWVDGAIAGSGTTARPIIVSRILGGNPMGATQLNTGRDAEDLVKAGLMTDLSELAAKEGWADFIRPSKLLDACKFEGKIYCVPVNIHSWQWMWTNPSVFKDAGVNPPANWKDLVAAAPKLKEKGVIPLATGDAWQVDGIFRVLLAAIGGKELYLKIAEKKDAEAAAGPEMKAVLQAFAEARELADPGYVGRQWNEATSLVLTGKAGAQVMGDWAQSEFGTAGKVAGTDYDCLPGLGVYPMLDTGGDAFYFPKSDNPEVTKAQLKLASMLVSKETQVSFNLAKGSLPIRGDIDLNTANACMQKGIKILADSNNVLPAYEQAFSSDTQGQIEDLSTEFFADKNMSVEDAQARFVEIITEAQ
ncbi:ABC transporter substrate-binding protein [Phyllobacterium sp. 0TCS1.6C]|uniref:ABC transporter substrate-binding protein n=1 Tax=unclassified Phyllobacterium TaxID=2638441 RepID=UPI0022644B47|nr:MULTISPECIES: ABC transporter substrate-binding protein [unclassified Phyllobacterium]MCX8279749.1 ABC transporter substrate-binding protein [Phyllobacterium sp. 0TCS1.6C]MCX8295647.1 ABC transporter substrate-binding protein [Phyllobacterium sp. 0TCS1.6A]